MSKKIITEFEEFLSDQFFQESCCHKDQFEDRFSGWLENLDVQELIDYGNAFFNQKSQ